MTSQATYAAALAVLRAWADSMYARGLDPFAQTSGNGNQGLDAMIAQSGTITLPQFNQAATDLGIPFTTGTSWLHSFGSALAYVTGAQVTTQGGSGNPSSSGSSGPSLAMLAAIAVGALVLVRVLNRR